MKENIINIDSQDVASRLDVVLTRFLENHTRSYIQNLIRSKYVYINGEVVIKPGYKVKYNDSIKIYIPKEQGIDILEDNIPLEIVYEDYDIGIIDKPKGLVVHPGPGNQAGTLANALLYHFDSLSDYGGELRPGIVHRLDKDTSGLMVIAKNNTAHQRLSEEFKQRRVERIYWALVERNIKNDSGTIDAPISRHPTNRKKMAVVESSSSRIAITHYRVLNRFAGYTLVELRLETGRTHQIRVHMSYFGNPVVGDSVYGSRRQKFNTHGQVLHAKGLGFIHPKTREYMKFEGQLPRYFSELIKIIKSS
ncbi:MAG: RluA family pseudouridine synthase [Clostridiales bacterium]|nr:RluA family pseudouridine synthase [Clostridiales bacterium]